MKAIVLDTNVLVSALLTPFRAPARVLDAMLARRVRLVFDDRILGEYAEVLARPRFVFDANDVNEVLAFIREEGLKAVAPPLGIALPDPDDVMFVEVAVTGRADAIVTGDKRRLPQERYDGIPVLSPAEFLALL